jgi:DNA polymerase beta thumb
MSETRIHFSLTISFASWRALLLLPPRINFIIRSAPHLLRLQPDRLRKGRSLVAAKEEDIYRALGLPFMEPELREGAARSSALKGKLPKPPTYLNLVLIACQNVGLSGGRCSTVGAVALTGSEAREVSIKPASSRAWISRSSLSASRRSGAHLSTDVKLIF